MVRRLIIHILISGMQFRIYLYSCIIYKTYNSKRKNCIVEYNQGSTKPLDCSSMMTEKSRLISGKISNFADCCLEVQVYCSLRGYCCLPPQDKDS